ncbi:MAG: DUF748 domain-containing protein [Thermodesulfobacteriota bacterium]
MTRKKAIVTLGALCIFVLLGFLAVPAILKPVLRNAISEALHRKAEIREVRFNPFFLSVSIRGLEISDRDSPERWVAAEEIFANLQVASVYRMGPVLKEIRLTRPHVRIVRRPDGTYNFSDILEEASKKPKKESKPLKYSFNNIQIVDGRVEFLDGPKGARHVVEGIQVAVPFVSNLKYAVDRYVTPSFAAVVNGDAVSLRGRTKPFQESLETAFEIDIVDLSLPRYLEYLPFRRDYEVPSALLDVKAVLSFRQEKSGKPSIRAEGYAQLRDVRITGGDSSPMIRLPVVRAVIAPADLAAREFRFASLTVRDPELDIVIDGGGRLNLLSMVPGKEGTAAGENGEKAAVSVDAFRISGGKIRFTDASRRDVFRTAIGELRIDAARLGNEEGKAADVSLSLSTESGESAGLKGTLKLAPLGSDGTLTVSKLALGKYAPYYGDAILFDVMQGTLDLQAGYSFAQGAEGARYRVHGLGATVERLRLRRRDEKEDFLEVPRFSLKDGSIDPERKEIAAGEISTDGGRVAIRRAKGGAINVARLVPETPPPADARAAPPWTVTAGKVSVGRYRVAFDDGATDPPAALDFDEMRLRAENVTTAEKGKGAFAFSTRFNREGTLSLGGSFSLEPVSMAGKLRAKTLPIGPLQPYFAESVKILLTGGSVSADGEVRLSVPKGGALQAAYRGDASVNGFASLDKERGEDFLKFSTLHFAGIDVRHRPTSVAIRDIALTDFYSRLIVNEDGTLNVQGILVHGGAADNAATASLEDTAARDNAAASPAVPVRIDAVTLQGGDVNFSDRYVKPNYSANLVEIGGRVSGLSSDESMLADVDLRGKLQNSAPLEIRGKINPLAKDLFLDLKVDFRDMDLSPLTPYSGRYAGYAIEKGKLTLNLAYHIEKRKLDAGNKVFIDQFTFGEAVDSPEATKLPVRLAVALLKDRRGEIRLDIPVTGRIDDPKFSVWRIVWQVVGNLLAKAATAPFALIGALFGGGGEELSYVEFDPGRSDIPAAGAGKLANLSKALYERPSLKLEIAGHADLERDREELRNILFRRKVAAQKVKGLARSGQPAPAIDNVRVEPAEYPKYLEGAYREEKFPKPRNALGMVKGLPAPEMEKLMLAHIRVTDGDLRQLAVERASRVRDALLADGKVEPGRIFLVEPKELAPGKKENLRDSRVDFLIK